MIISAAVFTLLIAGVGGWLLCRKISRMYLITLGISVIVSVAIALMVKAIDSGSQTADVEYWGGYVTEVQYIEDWDEYIHRTCSWTDSKGNTHYYDCSYVDYHPEEWRAIESNGSAIRISQLKYNQLVVKFGVDPKFRDLHRDYYMNDGDMYHAVYKGERERLEPVTLEKRWVNKVQSSSSIFNFPRVDDSTKSQYKLYDYPEVRDPFTVPGILDHTGKVPKQVMKDLEYLNSTLGAPKKVRVWILLFRDLPDDAGHYQEWLWKGGNKNELVLCIGLSGNVPTWAYPISWTSVERIKVEVADHVMQMDTLDLGALVKFIHERVYADWEKRDFREFDYIETATSTGATIWATVLAALVGVGAIFKIWADHQWNDQENVWEASEARADYGYYAPRRPSKHVKKKC